MTPNGVRNMKKGTYQIIAVVLVIIMVFSAIAAALYFGVLQLNIGRTTTTTTTGPAAPGDFFIDECLEGNTEPGTGLPRTPENGYPHKVTTVLKVTEKDYFDRGTAVSGSGSIVFHDYNTESEVGSITFSSGSGSTSQEFVSGQHLKYEVTESGYVNYFGEFTVPYSTDDDPSDLEFTIYLVDIPTWGQTCHFLNNTEIADSGTLNTTTDLTSNLAELKFENSHTTDDDGWISCYNFLKDVYHNAYFAMHFTGTGTDSVQISSADSSYGRVVVAADADVWVFWEVGKDDLSRDLLSDGVTRDPNGRWTMGVTLDLSGITSGDSVTCTYGVYYVADSAYLRSNSQWYPQNGYSSVTDTFTIAP